MASRHPLMWLTAQLTESAKNCPDSCVTAVSGTGPVVATAKKCCTKQRTMNAREPYQVRDRSAGGTTPTTWASR